MKENTVRTIQAVLLMLAGLGCLKVAELTGRVNIHIESMDISPAQASIIRNDLTYEPETVTPQTRKKNGH